MSEHVAYAFWRKLLLEVEELRAKKKEETEREK